MQQTYRASCHCGKVVAEADLDLEQPSFRCNCSICRRTRFWPAVARPEQFRLLQGEDALVKYVFAGEKNHHFFCGTCGVRVDSIQPLESRARTRAGKPPMPGDSLHGYAIHIVGPYTSVAAFLPAAEAVTTKVGPLTLSPA